MKIYTKTGDDGTTGLFSGKRLKKNAALVEAYGSVDEVNAAIGFAQAATKDKQILESLQQVQHDLHGVGSDLATPMDAKKQVSRTESKRTKALETQIDEFEKELSPLKNFILAGGSELSARLHLARTVARRAERRVLSAGESEKINSEVIIYLNRLSDFLFVLARVANKRASVADIPWDQSR